MTDHTLYLSLGANLGERERTLDRACQEIERGVGHILRRSKAVETQPWGFSSTHPFLNACVCCLTPLTPLEALRETQRIERLLGRREKSRGGRYHDREIDIDLLLYDDLHLHTPELTLPHPLMGERDFVMRPLREILPG